MILVCPFYSTPNDLNTASSALLENIKLKQPTSSGGTLPKSTAEVIGNNTFFAPESKHTCKVFARFSTFDTVPLTLISLSIANELTVGF